MTRDILKVITKIRTDLFHRDDNGQLPDSVSLTRDDAHALIRAAETTEPDFLSIAQQMDEFKSLFELVRQEIETLGAIQMDASDGDEYMREEFVDFRSALGKLATGCGYDLVQVLSFGKIGSYQQHLTYRIYKSDTDELCIHSLGSLAEAHSDLDHLREDFEQQQKGKT
jgi:hypothetical protein